MVKNFNIRFNTSITFKEDNNVIYIHDDYGNDSYKTVVDGNIVINLFNKNNTKTKNYPLVDIDNEKRTSNVIDLQGFLKSDLNVTFQPFGIQLFATPVR